MKIEYRRKGDEIHFSYEEVNGEETAGGCSIQTFRARGEIPAATIKEGAEAIAAYAKKKVKAKIAQQKRKAAKQQAFAANPNFPLRVFYENCTLNEKRTLSGRIVSAKDSVLVVRLEKPFTGEKRVRFGFASAMGGHFIFDRDKANTFSDYALSKAYDYLVEIYEQKRDDKKHLQTVRLVDALNRSKK